MASNSSVQQLVDNAVSIPYHDGLSLGYTVDVRGRLEKGTRLVGDGVTTTASQVNLKTCKFSLATSFSHVCEVLDIPPEYALKVEAGLLHNDVIGACLKDVYNKASFKLIFRLRYIRERQHFFNPTGLMDGDVLSGPQNLTDEQRITGLGDTARDTHIVEAVDVGDELVVIMSFSAPEMDALQTFYKKIELTLGKASGYLEEDFVSTLQNMAASVDNKLGKSHYKHVTCDIQYGSFHQLDAYPTSVQGAVRIMVNHYTDKWGGADDVTVNPHVSSMAARIGIDTDDETTVKKTLLDSMELFKLRVTLQPYRGNEGIVPHDCSQHFENMYSCLYALKRTDSTIQEFLKCHTLFSVQDYMREGEDIRACVSGRKAEVVDAIERLGMVQPVSGHDVAGLQNLVKDLPDMVDCFIKKVTSTLPRGDDLNLLIIGKTGHGKSSTANTILGRKEFATSSGGVSQTKECQRSWAEVDGRTFKVVDVPGVCDTDFDSTDSVKLAIRCISEAISSCSDGFHALLLVIRYGNRMTEEEERAVYILKCILGQAIVHSHCICVVTYGDNFETNEGSFQEWCERQEGFLKEVFEECNYRCVLFNNKTTDPAALKTQLIELVSKVDSLQQRGCCYSNDIFKHAEQDRQRLIEELHLPQFKEDILRSLSLLQGDFDNMENGDENERKLAFVKMKDRAENLRQRLDQIKSGGIADLYQAVSAFIENIHRLEEKELADAQLLLERERFRQEEQRLKAEREAMERRVAEQTELRVREAAEAAERKERELREMEKEKWEAQKRHEEEVRAVKDNVANYYKKKSRWVTFRDSVFKW